MFFYCTSFSCVYSFLFSSYFYRESGQEMNCYNMFNIFTKFSIFLSSIYALKAFAWLFSSLFWLYIVLFAFLIQRICLMSYALFHFLSVNKKRDNWIKWNFVFNSPVPLIPDGRMRASYLPAPKIWSSTFFSFSRKLIFALFAL